MQSQMKIEGTLMTDPDGCIVSEEIEDETQSEINPHVVIEEGNVAEKLFLNTDNEKVEEKTQDELETEDGVFQVSKKNDITAELTSKTWKKTDGNKTKINDSDWRVEIEEEGETQSDYDDDVTKESDAPGDMNNPDINLDSEKVEENTQNEFVADDDVSQVSKGDNSTKERGEINKRKRRKRRHVKEEDWTREKNMKKRESGQQYLGGKKDENS